jgi:hypothetical protein
VVIDLESVAEDVDEAVPGRQLRGAAGIVELEPTGPPSKPLISFAVPEPRGGRVDDRIHGGDAVDDRFGGRGEVGAARSAQRAGQQPGDGDENPPGASPVDAQSAP